MRGAGCRCCLTSAVLHSFAFSFFTFVKSLQISLKSHIWTESFVCHPQCPHSCNVTNVYSVRFTEGVTSSLGGEDFDRLWLKVPEFCYDHNVQRVSCNRPLHCESQSLLSSLDNNEFVGSGCCWIDLTAQHKLALTSLTYIIAHVSTLSAATASGKNFNVILVYWSCILSHAWDTMRTREVPSLQCSVIVGWRKTLDLSLYFPTPKALYGFLKSTTPSVDTSQSTQRKMFA